MKQLMTLLLVSLFLVLLAQACDLTNDCLTDPCSDDDSPTDTYGDDDSAR